MSKMDDMRAMREARFDGEEPSDADAAGERLCGHRAIGGRTCTREHGHEAKSHRYS
ncbi:MAG: hypothetical protein JWO76_3553 [Nocardioides sp.]|nr:hypothetical protein [Nocardioides sp.]